MLKKAMLVPTGFVRSALPLRAIARKKLVFPKGRAQVVEPRYRLFAQCLDRDAGIGGETIYADEDNIIKTGQSAKQVSGRCLPPPRRDNGEWKVHTDS